MGAKIACAHIFIKIEYKRNERPPSSKKEQSRAQLFPS